MMSRTVAQQVSTVAMRYRRGTRLPELTPALFAAGGWEAIEALGRMLLAPGAAWERGTCAVHGPALGSEGSCLACGYRSLTPAPEEVSA